MAWATAALSVVGVVVTLIGAIFENLRVVQVGVACCLPMILVYYAALGMLGYALFTSFTRAILGGLTGAREWVRWRRKCVGGSKPVSPKGVWDREIDG